MIALRPWTEDDVPEIVRLTADPEIPRWTRVPERNTADIVRAWLAATPEGELHLAIVDPDRGAILGSVGLIRFVPEALRAEVGYWVGAEHRGRGVAAEAVRQIADCGFSEFGLRRIELHAHPDNRASRRVAEKAGFVLEGILRAYEPIKDRLDDVALYARLAG